MTDNKKDRIPNELELRSLHYFLGRKSIYDIEIAAEYDERSTRGWWSNYWNDWDELREEERYDHWFTKDIREMKK
ncbi:hypothetical protein BBF96_15155 [Anoxybacter fermentans]|uniref:Uncharacterized protein n=1 Tax=Anoxybacter fermentans TaxID=1323375 RepID=A0A3Q9HST2_9FIRM|nr:hypothetical protein [Anoxybacter fermentans]AZR74594.1 hypothetical protein BBF96_15155 [Anoxybacter fermentans]